MTYFTYFIIYFCSKAKEAQQCILDKKLERCALIPEVLKPMVDVACPSSQLCKVEAASDCIAEFLNNKLANMAYYNPMSIPSLLKTSPKDAILELCR